MAKTSYETVKDWRWSTKIRLVQAFGSKCGCCGLVDHPICYDFHHLDPKEKDFLLTSGIKSWERIVPEAEKCCMLCAHCHRKYHHGIVELPPDVAMFDETLIERKTLFDDCPVCKESKPKSQTTCSKACARKYRYKFDWDSIDLVATYLRCGSFLAMSREIGVGDASIKKQMRKRGLLAAIGKDGTPKKT